MASEAYLRWRQIQLELGRRVEPVAAMRSGHMRWGAFENGKGEMSAFFVDPMRPEMDRELPNDHA